MTRVACDSTTEVLGQVMLSYLYNMPAEAMTPLMRKHGMTDIQPDEWYSIQPLLDIFEQLARMPNYETNMIAIGMKIAEFAMSPPELADVTLAQVLEEWDQNLYTNTRHGDIGHIITEKVSDTHYRTIHTHIYPDALSYGLVYGFARAKLPEDTNFRVWYENENDRLDNGGGDKTIIAISWQ